MAVNYDDKRLTSITEAGAKAEKDSDALYDSAIAESKEFYKGAIDKIGVMDENGNWNEGSMADIQTDAANERTDWAIEQIEQQKDQAQKDYVKEQAAAYHDYKRASDPYGVNAEKMAAAGLSGATGYLSSVQERYFNTYQNRLTAAREVYSKAVLNYDNAIKDAKVQNNSVLAEIALSTLQEGLKLSLEGFQYKNTLLLEKADKKRQINQDYHSRYLAELDQINTEKALEEQKRQADLANAREQERIKIAQAELKIQQEKWNAEKEAAAQATAQAAAYSQKPKAKTPTKTAKEVGQIKQQNREKTTKETAKQQYYSAAEAIEQLIAKGASKDTISNQISLALRKGQLTQQEAANLRRSFTPRGVQY